MNDEFSAFGAGPLPAKRRRAMPVASATSFALLCAGTTLWLMLHPGEARTSEPAASAAAMTVTEVTAQSAEWPVQLEASGAIVPWQEAVIGSQVAGVRLIELHGNPGDVVRRGQVLARFDTDALRADVAQLRASLRQAQAQAAQALADRDRALKLKGSGSMSDQEVLQAVTQAETASAQTDSSHAQLASRELQLKYATVLAPDDGVISARSATLGTVGTVGEELFRLIRQNRLEWQGELTAAQLGQAARGQTVTLVLPDGQIAEAKLRQLAPSLNAKTRLGLAYADLLPGSTARAGMYAEGRIVVTGRKALVVPAGSVVIRDGRSHVFTLNAQEAVPKVAMRAVKIGRRQANEVEIVQGLVEGDRVLVQGAGFLNDGDRVQVVQAPAAGVPNPVKTNAVMPSAAKPNAATSAIKG